MVIAALTLQHSKGNSLSIFLVIKDVEAMADGATSSATDTAATKQGDIYIGAPTAVDKHARKVGLGI